MENLPFVPVGYILTYGEDGCTPGFGAFARGSGAESFALSDEYEVVGSVAGTPLYARKDTEAGVLNSLLAS